MISKIENFKNEKLKEFMLSVMHNKEIEEPFKKHPGSIQIHHNWISGLLQHTYEVVRICELCGELFPELDKDLTISGAILHDIGKIKEVEVTTRIKGTKKGQLKGHIVQGALMVSAMLEKSNLDDETKDKLLHIILSHHGTKENGSPKEPMTAEAFAVYLADLMSSQLSHIIEFIKENRELTKDEFMYHYQSKRNILLK
ncbi:MAG: HD domain-containing protein [Candidatus Diapherotrites archaeon]|nr:HD domain-containing protein [Candidatus Diapherotrites archaeon]